jgi:hypothetical protein
MMAFSGMRI